jgi:Kunitz/Bovine pancreatic trypsin inhibitor domain
LLLYIFRVVGICPGEYDRFYYDQTYKQCVPFVYSGCLGNTNNFKNKQDCEKERARFKE